MGEGDGALAAALTAVKLGVPTAWVASGQTDEPVLSRLADESLGATRDASAIAAAMTGLAAPTIAAR